MLHAVVMGDIGWPHLYHVGDEAMTEAAVHQLRARGVEKITLVAADPDTATTLYSVPAVPRFHFKLRWPREWHDSHLKKVLAPLDGYERGNSPATTVLDAVHDADFVVIAGGGNLTSAYVHQMFERLALIRVARHFGRPVFVSSQTLDSAYQERDLPIISEILDGSELFGLREATSLAVARALAVGEGAIRAVGDDGLLTPRSDLPVTISDRLPERYMVASFERPTWLEDDAVDEYYESVANSLQSAAERLDCDVLLVPHAGSFDAEHPKDDIESHRAIASHSARIRDLPLMRAAEVLGVMAPALCTVSTRYHPLVFGAQLELPMIGLARTAYTWHRMRGAARQYGAEHHIMPIAVLEDPVAFAEVLEATVASGDLVRGVAPASRRRRAHQQSWWDEIVARARMDGDGLTVSTAPSPLTALEDPVSVPLPSAIQQFGSLIGDESTARAEAEARADRLQIEFRRVNDLQEDSERRIREATDRASRTADLLARERREAERQAKSAKTELFAAREELRGLEESLQLTVAERDEWRRAARSFRSEVQRYRDRKTTRIVDGARRLFRSR